VQGHASFPFRLQSSAGPCPRFQISAVRLNVHTT
jgi:hypothetical protein